MEKKKKLDVSNIDLVSFEGFYQTIWDSSFEVSDYEYQNEVTPCMGVWIETPEVNLSHSLKTYRVSSLRSNFNSLF